MEIIGWCVLYLVFAAPCYYVLYANAVASNFRLNVPFDKNASAWQDFIVHNKGVLGLLARDFLKIHCPWSKEISTRYRVQEARSLLRNMTHKKGWTVADCDNQANHQQIAKDCFRSRTRFWIEGVFTLLASPLLMVFVLITVLVALVVLPIISAGKWFLDLVRK